MSRRCRMLRGPVLLLCAAASLVGHEDWYGLHLYYSGNPQYTYPFDGRSPKIAAALLNHAATPSPGVIFSVSVNGQPTTGFPAFPEGGPIVAAGHDYGIAAVPSSGIHDGRFGPALAVGETREFVFRFAFALAPGELPPPGSHEKTNPDPANNHDVPGITTARVKFQNLGDDPVISGPLPFRGTLRIASGAVAGNPRVEVATPYSKWFAIPLTTVAGGYAFAQSLLERHDWHVRFSADHHETVVLARGFAHEPHPDYDITLAPAATPDLDYRRIAAIATPTGFWRGAVSESEGTFTAFPGQENWAAANTAAERRAQRSVARIYKYRFDGTKVWEHAPGWETWAGDMSADGRFVAYALNPTVESFHTPAEHQLVLLDGGAGTVIWIRAGAPSDALIGRKVDSQEIVFSPDARWLAVGSSGGGTVTLVDRATGTFAWTVPGPGVRTFGQVRKLRFSADSQSLFVGSGDGQLRKLRVSDGAVAWQTFVGSWPQVNGLELTADGTALTISTNSLDAVVVRSVDGIIQWRRETQFPDAVAAPDNRHLATAGGQVYRVVDGSLAGMAKVAALTRFTPDGRHLLQFDRDLRLSDLGGKWLKTFEPSGLGDGAAPRWAHLTRDGRYALVLGRDFAAPMQVGIAIYERLPAGSGMTAPSISTFPLTQTVARGSSVSLVVGAAGSGPLSYQWRKNGIAIPDAAGATHVIAETMAPDAGTYSCVVSNAAGTTTSPGAVVSVAAPEPANPARLTNLSVRARATPGAPVTLGFAVGGSSGTSLKPLLIRGAGPSLRALQVDDALADPRLTLFHSSLPIQSNDDWAADFQAAALSSQVGAFPFAAATSKDAALAATAVNGSYTVQLASGDASSGTALAEIYDATREFGPGTPRLVNASARANVGAAGTLVAGFVIAGHAARTVLIRGIGPGLAQFGVLNAVTDPQLTLFRDSTPLAANDNWHDAANAVAIATAAGQAGAFRIPPGSRDAGLLLSLPPGAYTVQVSDAGGAVGNALVEIYEVP